MLKSVNINFGDSRKLRVTFTHEICCMPHSLCGNINNTVRIIAMILRFLVLHFPAQTFGFTLTKSPGMQASIIKRLSQARINWDGCDRKGIRWHKNGRDDGGGGTDSPDGAASRQIVSVSASVIFPCTIMAISRLKVQAVSLSRLSG